MTSTHRVLSLLLVLALPGVAGAAGHQALSADGAVHTLVAGYYANLFADGNLAAPATPVLALDVEPGGQRLLVPGSEAPAEDTARLIFAEGDRVTLLWESLELPDHRVVYLAQWDGATWSEVHAVHRGTLGVDAAPRLAVSRDRKTIGAGAGAVETSRTVVHLVWQELAPDDVVVRYSPLVFADGVYIGWNDSVSLSHMYSAGLGGPAAALDPASELAAALAVEAGDDSVAVTFADVASGKLVTAEVRPLALEILLTGDEIATAARRWAGLLPEDPGRFGDKMRAQIVGVGRKLRLRPELVDVLVVATDLWTADHLDVLAADGSDAFADGLRRHAVDLTAGLSGTSAPNGSQMLEIDVAALLGAHVAGQVVEVAITAERTLPAIGPGATTILTAGGDAATLAWHDATAGALRYVESTADGWTAPKTLVLGPTLGVDGGLALLAGRLE